MTHIKSVCVFCGASNDVPDGFIGEAYSVGKQLAEHNLHLVYGAGDCGLMKHVANGVLENGGSVTGVFPKILEGLEAEHKSLTETILVDDMHTRKMTMFNKSDAFLILPGGFGTMDEAFEVITWKQLHTHNKPVVFYNFKNYYEYWVKLTDQFIALGFASQKTRHLYHVVDSVDAVFEKLYTS